MAAKTAPKFTRRDESIPGGRWTKNLHVQEFDLPGGKAGRWESLNVGETPTILLCGLTPEKKLVLVNLFRFPVNSFCTELPGGCVDQNETLEQAVLREFEEETGHRPKKVSPLCGGFLWNGKSSGRFQVWFGEECEKVAEVELDPVEQYAQLTVEIMDPKEVMDLIVSGDMTIDPPIAHAILAMKAKGIL